ncbi:phosphatidylserine decarboxylase family protein [bacterium]|nr:phosphatidylserine decarboxylase family protein [bacterium]
MKTTENFPIAREAFPYLGVLVAAGAALAVGGLWQGTVVLALLAAYVVFFFRNPERQIPGGVEQVACPADGKVIFVGQATEKEFLQEERTKISIFMSLFDVHINRVPVDGTVEGLKYHPGRYLAAWDDRSCEENERNTVLLRTQRGETMVLVQIAGLVARRIVCYPQKGAFVTKGQRLGLIQFGSRVDVYLPPGAKPLVHLGDRVKGGETLLAKLARG